MYMQRTTSGAAGNGLYITIKYMRGAAGIGLGTTIKYLRRTTSGTVGNGLGAMIKFLSAHVERRREHRGTSLGPFECGARACSLCSLFKVRPFWATETPHQRKIST
jgi:hypothetical protein